MRGGGHGKRPRDFQRHGAQHRPSTKNKYPASIPVSTKVIQIGPEDNAWRKLKVFLHQVPTVDAIHVLLPSSSASLGTGASALAATDVNGSADFSAMAATMKQPSTVDFLVYSCQLADNSTGKDLLKAIDAATGFNVVSAVGCTSVLSPDFKFDYSTKNKLINAGNLLE